MATKKNTSKKVTKKASGPVIPVTWVKVTSVRRWGRSNLRGLADIELGGLLIVRGVEIREDNNDDRPRLYVAFQDDRHFHEFPGWSQESFTPATMPQRKAIEDAVFAEYSRVTGKALTRKDIK